MNYENLIDQQLVRNRLFSVYTGHTRIEALAVK